MAFKSNKVYWYYISNFPKATDLSKKIDSYELFGKANTIAQEKEMLKDGDKVIITNQQWANVKTK